MIVIPNSTLINTVSLNLNNSGSINNEQVHFDVGSYSLDISSGTGNFWMEQTVGTPFIFKSLTDTTPTIVEIETAGTYTVTLQGGAPNQNESLGIYKIQDLPSSGQNLYQNLLFNDFNSDAYSRWNAETKMPGYSAVVFYKFNEVAADGSFDKGATQATFVTLNTIDRALVESTFAKVEQKFDIKFIAIDSNDTSITPNILINGTTNLSGSTAGYADFPQATGGDGALTLLVDPNATGVGINEAVLVHELGHSLGLKHTFSSGGPLPALTGTQEASFYDNKYFSIMSYTTVGQNFDEFRQFDVEALTYLYGASGTNPVTHSYNPVSDVVTFTGTSGDDKIAGSSINDIINANGGADIVFGSSGDDEINGGDGNDFLNGGRGADKVYGGGGNDTLIYTRSVLSGTNTAHIDLYDGGAGTDTLDASANEINAIIDLSDASKFISIETLIGTNNPIKINSFADYLYGDNLNNKIYGLAGSDNLKGNGGDDELYGGAGNDQLDGGTGSDYLNGGIGTDTAFYQGNENSYTRTTNALGQTIIGFNGDVDTLVNIENIKFSDNTVSISSNINTAPIAFSADAISTSSDLIILAETSIYKMAGYFLDVDGNSLTYTATSLPNGLTINSTTGVISGQMTASAATNNVTVSANDANGGSTSVNFAWQVAGGSGNANNTPITTGITDLSTVEKTSFTAANSTFKMSDHFSDPDGDTLFYSATNLPQGLAIDETTGVIIGTLTAAKGSYSVTIVADDKNGATISSTFKWEITKDTSVANIAPTATTINAATIAENTTVSPGLSTYKMADYFNDADGDALTYSATSLPAGLTINATSGVISGTLSAAVGNYSAVITVDDGFGGTANSNFNWIVEAGVINPNVNDVIIKPLGLPIIDGLTGHDKLVTLAGLSKLDGGDDNDFIMGGFETDKLFGGAGNDLLRGDASDIMGGADYLRGDLGNDILMGGMGSDTFFFRTNHGNDVIAGFKANQVSFDANSGYSVQPSFADFEVGIDHIMLAGFTDIDTANIISFLADGADGAVWQHDGTSITFYGINAAQIDANDFVIL